MSLKVKKSFICRAAAEYAIDVQRNRSYLPQAGDIALFKVLKIGKHTRIQCADEHNHLLLPGDLVLAAFGNRYATNQLEGYVPDKFLDEYHILGQGGVVGEVASFFYSLEATGPTSLQLLGYATDQRGNILNTKRLAAKTASFTGSKPFPTQVILSLGTSMDSGKTTTAAYLCRGLKEAGLSTAYMKLTGTAYGKDPSFAVDCGADTAVDFSAAGFPSTYLCDMAELLDLYAALLGQLASSRPEVVVIEIADGLLQRETHQLLSEPRFMATVDQVIFSAGDSMGALFGLDLLKQKGIHPFALSGLFTMSPLLIREVQQYTNVPVLRLGELESPDVLKLITGYLAPLEQHAGARLNFAA